MAPPAVILCRPRQCFLLSAYLKGLLTSISPYPQRTPSSGDLSGLLRLTGVATSHHVPLPRLVSHTHRGILAKITVNPLRYLPLVSFLRPGGVRIPGCQLDSNPGFDRSTFGGCRNGRLRTSEATALSWDGHVASQPREPVPQSSAKSERRPSRETDRTSSTTGGVCGLQPKLQPWMHPHTTREQAARHLCTGEEEGWENLGVGTLEGC